jgi:competence protein ComEC
MALDDASRRELERPIATRRARRQNPFSARGTLACPENFLIAALAAAAGVVLLTGAAFSAGSGQGRPILPLPEGQLVVAMLDVGQGDAIFVQTPDRFRMLVDAGPGPTDRDPTNAGRDKIVPFLERHGIGRLDAFVMSHAHADHIGGLAYLLQSVAIDRVYDPGFVFSSPVYEHVLQLVENSGGRVDYRIPGPGETLPLGNAVLGQVLAPPRPHIQGTRSDCNSNSLVLRLAYGEVTMLFMGDAEEETEEMLAQYGSGLRSTILKVAHHGSRYSSSEFFLQLVQPRHAFISAGRGNVFGHPHQEALERLAKVGARIHRTDEGGDILLVTDGKRYRIVESRKL